MNVAKKILLVDLNDPRRYTRQKLLESAGYEVEMRNDHEIAELLNHELYFDLVVLTLHHKRLQEAAAYGERLSRKNPNLPVLLLTDGGVYAPQPTLSRSLTSGHPLEMLEAVAELLAGSRHIRSVDVAPAPDA